jgi:type II secretory pathway predicted ATPase ExeA
MEREAGLWEIPQTMPGANENLPTREQIERRARQIYVERGGQGGSELADWLAAEKELAQVQSAQDTPAESPSPDFQQIRGPAHMFLEFFGLRQEPFGMTPDPAYLYASKTHSEALASLSLGIADNRGFFALVAQPGMGKTTLLYQLLEKLRDSTRTVLLFQTQCTSRELIEYILQDLGVDARGMGLVAMHGKLNEILFGELLAGKRFVLVIDEAQNLDDSVLETVRMLCNFETHNAKLLQIVLAGQPRLAAKLAQPRLSQLRQRIAVLSHLEPFTVEETGLYIEHRLKIAGHAGDPIFDPASIAVIARQSDGIPRNINNICYNSLLLAYNRGLHKVTAEIVQEAATRLDVELLIHEPPSVPVPAVAAPADVPNAPVAIPDVPAAAAIAARKVAATQPKPVPVPKFADRRVTPTLTYSQAKNTGNRGWRVRSAILAAIVLFATLLIAILGRSESAKGGLTPAIVNPFSNIQASPLPADRSNAKPSNYDAAPQDTEIGQVITVMAAPQQTLKDLTLRYAGHFDSELSNKIRSLNPDLKDPDHLEAGQLIRIPLPSGALKKVNDTAEDAAPSKPETSGNLFNRFTALLRARK